MKKIFSKRKVLAVALLISAAAFIAGVPLADDKTVLEQIRAAFPSGDAEKPKQQEAKKSLDEVWEEMQKLSEHNGEDTVTLSGKIKLYDNADDNGIKEEQHFLLQQAGDNQWFALDSFVRIQMSHNMLLIDHAEKEIVTQYTGQTDSLYAALRMMDPQKLKGLLVKDGTTASIRKEGAYKVLNIQPGTMDAVNEYNIFYDTATYEIHKISLSYTSTPYQDYMEDYKEPGLSQKRDSALPEKISPPRNATDSVNDNDIEMNITEYVIEYEIDKKEKKCAVNFLDNNLFKVNGASEVTFKGKLAGYKKVEY